MVKGADYKDESPTVHSSPLFYHPIQLHYGFHVISECLVPHFVDIVSIGSKYHNISIWCSYRSNSPSKARSSFKYGCNCRGICKVGKNNDMEINSEYYI